MHSPIDRVLGCVNIVRRTARRILIALGATVMGVGALAGLALAAEGDLDPTFNGGKPVVVFAGPAGSATNALGVAKQSDGKIVVVGATDSGNGVGSGTWVIERLLLNGQPDPAFGTQGVVRLDMGNFSRATGVVVQPSDQRIVVGGTAGGGDVAFVRLNADGSPDSSFGATGTVLLSRANDSVTNTGTLALGKDGKLFLAGSVSDSNTATPQSLGAIASVSSGGAQNPWASGGILVPSTAPHTAAAAVAVADNGTVFWGGQQFDSSFASHAILGAVNGSGGTPVAAFGSGGVFMPFGIGTAINGLMLATDGKLKVAGFGTGTGPGTGALIASFNTSGANPTDTAFGSGGKVIVGGAANTPNNANAITEQNGNLFAATTAVLADSSTQIALVGVNEKTGALDTGLGPAGFRIYGTGSRSFSTAIADLTFVGVEDPTPGGNSDGLVGKVNVGLFADLTASIEVRGFGDKADVANQILADVAGAGPFRQQEFLHQLAAGTTAAGVPKAQDRFSSSEPVLLVETFANLGPTSPAGADLSGAEAVRGRVVLSKGAPSCSTRS